MTTIVPRVAWQMDALLGEGPIWLAGRQRLHFVDIKRGHVHAFDPQTSNGETWNVGGSPTFIVPDADGGLIVGSGNALHRFADGQLRDVIADVPEGPDHRTNDATVDDHGRLWFGTMHDPEETATGAIWCLVRGSLHRAGPRAVVTNGPAVSCDSTWLYHVDSGERVIWRHQLGSTADLGQGEAFVTLGPDDGYPDGIVIDAEDCVWVALWDGWGVRRYSPAGALLLHIALPCARITKIAFGGPDLRTAFVTSARVGLSNEQLTAQPLAGSLFAFDAPAAGRLVPEVRLK